MYGTTSSLSVKLRYEFIPIDQRYRFQTHFYWFQVC